MERYRLIFSGKRCGNYAKLPLSKHLSVLNLSDSAKHKITNGSKVSLQAGLSLEKAQEQQSLFEKMGLVTKRRLQLDSAIFEQNLVDAQTQPSSIDDTLPVHLLDRSLAAPSLFSLPSSGKIMDERGKNLLSLKTHNYQLGTFALIVISAALGLHLQSYVVILVGHLELANIFATLIGVVFLLATVLTFPRLFQPLLELDIKLNEQNVFLYEQTELFLGKRRFLWETPKEIGEITITSSKGEAMSAGLRYEWHSSYTLEQSGIEAIENIQDAIIDETIIGSAKTLLDHAKQLLNFLRSKNQETDWSLTPASVVTQADGEVVALIYQQPQAAYKILRKHLLTDPVLHSFCITVHRAGLA